MLLKEELGERERGGEREGERERERGRRKRRSIISVSVYAVIDIYKGRGIQLYTYYITN